MRDVEFLGMLLVNLLVYVRQSAAACDTLYCGRSQSQHAYVVQRDQGTNVRRLGFERIRALMTRTSILGITV